jgi:orotidine-5'-phosphate decarboxylase
MQLGAYLHYGSAGFEVLAKLPKKIGPTRLRILDAKANDIPNVMRMFRDGAFSRFGFDAITVTPWLGWETLEPFVADPAHGTFVVAHSSNPGALDFQEIPTPRGPLWLAVVAEVRRLAHAHGNIGVVIGATFSDALRHARAALGNGIPILVPGIGAQGGSLATAVREGVDAHGRALLVNASRSILYASAEADWRRAAGAEAARLKVQINQLRAGLRTA